MPHCKNLEIFSGSGSEGGDQDTDSAWDTFQRYRCLENSQSVVKVTKMIMSKTMVNGDGADDEDEDLSPSFSSFWPLCVSSCRS